MQTLMGNALEDLAAERAVLGAVLADNSVLADIAEVVGADDFSSPAHTQIFVAMMDVDSTGRKVDHLTLSEQLKLRGMLGGIGGPAYLMGLDQVVPVASNATQYAQIVKDQAMRRRLATVGREIFEIANQPVGEVEVLLEEAQKKVFQIAEGKRAGDLRSMEELMPSTLDLIDKMRENTTGVTGLATGYIDLDLQLTGFHAGELLILAARPGIGKTSFAMNIALNAVLAKEPAGAAIFSLEMPAEQLMMRLLSSAARVDMKRLRSGRLSEGDYLRFNEVAEKLFKAPLFIDDTGSLSPFDLRAKARRLKQRQPNLGLIVIDYLQLMHQKGRVESRQLEVSEISRSLKSLSKEIGVPILALSQLSRKVEDRKDGKPMLSDLRESGAIEQDADVVMFIHREMGNGEAPPPGESGGAPPDAAPVRGVMECELVIAKQRNGPIGDIPLVFIPEYTRFESRARGDWS